MKDIKNSIIGGFSLIGGILFLGLTNLKVSPISAIKYYGMMESIKHIGIDSFLAFLFGVILFIVGLFVLIAELFSD